MIRRIAAAVVACACLAAGLRAAAAVDAPVTLRLEIPLDPHTLNPLLTTEQDEFDLTGLMFDPLVKFDGELRPVPVLVREIPTRANGGISGDGRTITMHLRRDLRWHDGAPLTAADVAFTMRTIVDPRNPIENRIDYATIARVDVLDPATVRFVLKRPFASFLANIAAFYPIVPEHLLGHSASLVSDPFNAHPVGSGPYRFVRWDRGDRVVLEANPAYPRGAPKIPRIDVLIVPDTNTVGVKLRRHEIDLAEVESSTFNQLRTVPGLATAVEPENSVNRLSMNEGRPLMRDVAIRRAIAKAIDKKRLVQTITQGVSTPAYGDLPLFMYDGHPPAGWDEADPAGARALLEADGWKLGSDGVRVRDGVPLRLLYIDYASSQSAASMDAQVMDMLRAVGIAVEYKTYAPSIYFQPAANGGPLRSGAYDLAMAGFIGGPDPDNSALFSCATRIPNGSNLANYCSPEMEGLLAASERTYDSVARRRIVAQIEDLVVRDAVIVALYHSPHRFVFDPALHRVHAGIVERWFGIEQWTKPAPAAGGS